MDQGQLIVSLFVIWTFALFVVLGGMLALGRIFQELERVSENDWKALGEPRIKVSFSMKRSDLKLPKNMMLLQYQWLFMTPSWAKGSTAAMKGLLLYRVFGFLSLIPALGVIYLMVNLPNYPWA